MSSSLPRSSRFPASRTDTGEGPERDEAPAALTPSIPAAPAAGLHAPEDGTPANEETAEGRNGDPLPKPGMSRYRVSFHNEISDSTGHDHHVCQFETEVIAAGEDQAILDAIAEFEKHEDVPNWRMRARTVECVRASGGGTG